MKVLSTWRSVRLWESAFERDLHRRHSLRTHGLLLGPCTLLLMWAVSALLKWAGVDALFARYEHLAIGEKKIAVGKAVPLGRMGHPDEIAGAAVFLASAEAQYITAQTLNVDGGNVMS